MNSRNFETVYGMLFPFKESLATKDECDEVIDVLGGLPYITTGKLILVMVARAIGVNITDTDSAVEIRDKVIANLDIMCKTFPIFEELDTLSPLREPTSPLPSVPAIPEPLSPLPPLKRYGPVRHNPVGIDSSLKEFLLTANYGPKTDEIVSKYSKLLNTNILSRPIIGNLLSKWIGARSLETGAKRLYNNINLDNAMKKYLNLTENSYNRSKLLNKFYGKLSKDTKTLDRQIRKFYQFKLDNILDQLQTISVNSSA